ncbi:hypothetical protein J2Z21_008673 [Streptomyces griseochromogenes]|uniref:DUF5666 domain-containing protein n=1 Tax=Streptomyces griseochromogenes TaxID=68214 RepID=A0A1B1B0F4_9ACTN|nr:hypothetical protein [Streptomyces griseochromogenes]ANP52242.1 hypothetical protein AVL59_24215 [Streptomyces griseochromogenes]MBP2055657.1 hypothetical protein [Streptomyces griseochromogenes]
MYKRTHTIRRTAVAAGLLGAAVLAASAPAQAAATSQDTQVSRSTEAGSWWQAAHFQGTVMAVHAGSIDVDVNGSVKNVDTMGSMVIGKLEVGAVVDVTNWGTGAVVVVLNNWG